MKTYSLDITNRLIT